jgi:hypothetical protein
MSFTSKLDSVKGYVARLMPWWSALILLIVQWLAFTPPKLTYQGKLFDVSQKEVPAGDILKLTPLDRWAEDLSLALVGFWMWAFLTNTYSRMLVSTSGEIKGSDVQLSKEIAWVFGLSFIAICVSIAAAHYGTNIYTGTATIASLFLPTLALF